jgi:multiple sugar transport system substrate-binding protein
VKKEITFTAVPNTQESVLQVILDAFEESHGIHVNLEFVEWETYRTDFVNMALQHKSGDVAMAGTPITSDLIGMNALRPFSLNELAAFGGQSAFLPSRWQSGIRPGSSQVWAVPWILDIRVIYYWRDMLAAASIDEATAFQTTAQFEKTLKSLQESGVEIPWVPYWERFAILHSVSSWIWAYGGNLFTPDGRKVIFHEGSALEGIKAYFKQLKYLPRGLPEISTSMQFNERKAAVMIGNAQAVDGDQSPQLGCAPMPGGSYVGGSDLMIWAHTRNETSSLQFVNYLSQINVLEALKGSGLLPLRLNHITQISDDPSPIRRTLARAALTGRTFPCVPMIGLLEDRLSQALFSVQQEIYNNPDVDIDALLRKRIVSLGNRTNVSLG